MTVRPDSRYAGCAVIPASAGIPSAWLATRRVSVPAGVGVEHVAVDGERLDHLAHRYYADPTAWWRIVDAHPDILHPLDLLQPGLRVAVPPPGASS